MRILEFFVCSAVLLLTNSALAQTVELSSRTFWLGESPSTMESDQPFFAPQRIQWLNTIIERDTVLRETVIHVDTVHPSIPVSERIIDPGPNVIPLELDDLPEHLVLDGYHVFGSSNGSLRRIVYLPLDPSAGFRVSCSQMDDMQSLGLCVVRATYPPDNLIWLMGRLYFPENPADRPEFFRQVAERMRDFTYCLDVTDAPTNPRLENPTLSNCQIEMTS
ncbi:hypothetical protein V8J82_22525 [Gymnodinialimonas sp. 2305UL16-5]|uniref:hypothetical protein n=1 Tax=Gymnodinialimonas mytili TaxID=3126503 RepID=UPI0030A7116F